MSASLTLARSGDLDRLIPMVVEFHREAGLGTDINRISAAIAPLLDGSPHGAIYLIGPPRAPVGYIAVTFGWSIAFGGLDATIDEFYIRAAVRGRGLGQEVIGSLTRALSEAGVAALHLEVKPDNERATRVYQRMGFQPRPGYDLLTWRSSDPGRA